MRTYYPRPGTNEVGILRRWKGALWILPEKGEPIYLTYVHGDQRPKKSVPVKRSKP